MMIRKNLEILKEDNGTKERRVESSKDVTDFLGQDNACDNKVKYKVEDKRVFDTSAEMY